MEKCNVVIVGAGPGGMTAALFLAQQGISSVLLEKSVFPRDKVCGDALSGKVLSVLKKLDPELPAQLSLERFATGSHGVSFFAPNRKCLRLPFKNSTIASNAPGYTVRRADFDNFLADLVKKENRIDFRENTEVSKIEIGAEKAILYGKDNSEILCADLVIMSNGAHSNFARENGVVMEPVHYSAGIRQYFRNVSGMDKDNFIELHFLKDVLPGYLWIFPLSENEANVGLGMRSDVVSRKRLNLKKIFADTLSCDPYLKKRFEGAEALGKIEGYGLPLGSKHRRISGDRYMLCGDAASLIDPFTGEGISNAMISGMFAAKQAEMCIRQADFGAALMHKYDQEVYRRLGKELNVSTKLQKLVAYPWLFDLVVSKANKNEALHSLISSMFDDVDLRKKFKDPFFYLKLLR